MWIWRPEEEESRTQENWQKTKGAGAGRGQEGEAGEMGCEEKTLRGMRVEEGRRRQKVGWRETDRKRGIERQLQRDQETRFPRRSGEDKWFSLTAAQG